MFLDIETRSACDLKVHGSYQYAKHETTRLLTVAWRFRGQDYIWLPGLRKPPPKSYVDLHLPGVVVLVGDLVPAELCRLAKYPFVGHNCWTFDRLVWNECAEGFEHVRWVDTYPLALAAGMPGGLDAIGKLLWGEGKYASGKDALKKASRADGPDDCEPENVPLGQLLLVAKYNVQDVRLTEQLYEAVTREARIPAFEHKVKSAHDTINNRGMRIDLPFVRALVNLSDESKAHAIAQIAALTDGALPDVAAVQSRARVIEWLRSQGVALKNGEGKDSLAKNIVSRYIDSHRKEDEEPDDEESDEGDAGSAVHKNLSRIVKVLELRMSALRVTGGKLDAALHAMDPDHRIRFWAVYWGAGTGRWAGRRIQPHNFPRPKEGIDTWALIDLYAEKGTLSYDDVKRLLPTDARGVDGRLLYPFLSVDDAASALLRSFIVPDEGDTLAAADLANIESRVLTWCANEKWLMQAFWDGADPYMTMAERIVGPRLGWPTYPDPKTGQPLPLKKHPYRQILGKVPYLAAGYQGGPDAIASYAAGMGFTLEDYGSNGAAMCRAYRMAHPAIAGRFWKDADDGRPIFIGGLWNETQDAAIRAVTEGVRTSAGRCVYGMSHGNLICTLPSERRLVYRKPLVSMRETPYGEKPALSYWNPRFGRKWLYGGMLVENNVQAISRDILAHAMVGLEEAGMPVILHVHDEAVSSTRPERFPDFMRIMTTCPEWLTKFPLAAEGSCMERYSKTPRPPVKDEEWRNGEKR